MSQKIKSMSQLINVLRPKIISTLELVAEDTKKEIDEYLKKYYNEYDPTIFYEKTEQLKNCCKIGECKSNGTSVSVEVYLDINSLRYSTKGADPYKTVKSGDAGLHGGWDISNLSRGQIPWSVVSGNNGGRLGSGTQIWEDPMRELIDNGKLIIIFKKCTQQRGLKIK